jgi:hypothetical protein
MLPLPFTIIPETVEDQSLFAGFVKGFAGHCCHRREGRLPFLTATFENRRTHGLVACEIAPIMA